MAKVSAINWTNKSVKAFAQDADPFDAIQEAARKLVLNAREKGWQGPPFNPLHIVEMLGVRGEANSSIARTGVRSPQQNRRGTAVRIDLTALRAWLNFDHKQSAVRRMDGNLRHRTSHGRTARPVDPSCEHPGNER